MTPSCPYCSSTHPHPKSVRFGSFKRRSDCQIVSRFRCLHCQKTFSRATLHPCYHQNKRQMNDPLRKLLCSGVSLRRAAIILHLSRTTVARKLIFLGAQSRLKVEAPSPAIWQWQFDDMETFEHTKCKPISITLAVEKTTRRILGFQTARMPAKGKLAALARKKYGFRVDERAMKRQILFSQLQTKVAIQHSIIQSDQNPHYLPTVKKYFPHSLHEVFKGRRGCIVGQGELKRGGFDPLFTLNHTCAMLRADINRLFRRTWCTTKKIERLNDHLSIYVEFHNQRMEEKRKAKENKA